MMVTHSPSMVERSLERRIRRLAGLLIAMSLVPGIALVVSSDNWRLLPPNVQWSAYLLSVVLLIAAWSLLQGDNKDSSTFVAKHEADTSNRRQ
jgi:hypothetical protein